jgi:hypothetical protein
MWPRTITRENIRTLAAQLINQEVSIKGRLTVDLDLDL